MAFQKRKGSPLQNAVRLKTIVSVFAKHGFQDLVQRLKLGRYKGSHRLNHLSMSQRLRMSFEELGPAFVKLGQLLATRPDLIPSEYCREFSRLHNQVKTLPFAEIEPVLENHFGKPVAEVFQSFDREPLAAASIAQVYRAVLKDGDEVVVKVQRPGISKVIRDDLNVLYVLADLLSHYIPEARLYNPEGIVNEFAKSLALETNFIVEANNVRRFAENFADQPNIKIPRVYRKFSGQRVLVMEKLKGTPLSDQKALSQEGIDPEQVMKTGLRCYLKMVFKDGLFHGDLHAGNMFVLPNNEIGLIDFGAVGRLNRKTQVSIANMLMALASEDYDRLAYEYVDLAPYTEFVDADRLAQDLRDLISPYYGLSMRDFNVGKTLMDSTAIAAQYKISLPSELVMFFKSIVAIEGMGRMVANDFDFLSYSLEFASELIQIKYEPSHLFKEFSFVTRDLNTLLSTMPRQLKQLLRAANSPEHVRRVEVTNAKDLRRSLEASANLLFLGLVIGSLIVGASLALSYDSSVYILGIPALSMIGYSTALFLGLLTIFKKGP